MIHRTQRGAGSRARGAGPTVGYAGTPGVLPERSDVGRRENELDPGTGALARFAADLRKLRRAAGNPSYRELAKCAHYSHNTLSRAASVPASQPHHRHRR